MSGMTDRTKTEPAVRGRSGAIGGEPGGSRSGGLAGSGRRRDACATERGRGGGGDGAGPGKGKRRGSRGTAQDVVLFAGAPIDEESAACVLCCVDDTDDVSGRTSTGYVSELVASQVADLGGRVVLGITRHQLLLAEGVPYTSHNSAMCFMALLPRGTADDLRERAVRVIASEAADAADPGLCVAELPAALREGGAACREAQRQIARLTEFGERAKRVVCTKDEAYALAESIPWVSLTEHGGTGDGVIGALAGVGLRLSGEDGRFRGKWDLAAQLGLPAERQGCAGEPGRGAGFGRGSGAALGRGIGQEAGAPTPADAPPIVEAGLVRKRIARLAGGEVRVVDVDGNPVADDAPFALSRAAKPIMRGAALTFVVQREGGVVVPCEKIDLGEIGNGGSWRQYCDRFELDNDGEECDPSLRQSCRNCLYRRWTPRGFACMAS